jgi:hypothetical protein
MSFGMHVERSMNGRRIEPGAEFPQPMQQLRFELVVICDEVDPDRWHGEVRFAGRTLVTTPSVTTDGQAGRDAQRAFDAKVVELFSSEG